MKSKSSKKPMANPSLASLPIKKVEPKASSKKVTKVPKRPTVRGC